MTTFLIDVREGLWQNTCISKRKEAMMLKFVPIVVMAITLSLSGATVEKAPALQSHPVPTNVPPLLVTAGGAMVNTPQVWENIRRPELLKTFEDELYGKRPNVRPKLDFETVFQDSNAVDGTALLKRVKITYTGPNGTRDFVATAFFPKDTKGPIPCTSHSRETGSIPAAARVTPRSNPARWRNAGP